MELDLVLWEHLPQDTCILQSSPLNYNLVISEYLLHSEQDQNKVVQMLLRMYKILLYLVNKILQIFLLLILLLYHNPIQLVLRLKVAERATLNRMKNSELRRLTFFCFSPRGVSEIHFYVCKYDVTYQNIMPKYLCTVF